MNGAVLDPNFDPLTCKQPVNRWIIGKVAAATAAVDKALDDYRFNDAANALYKFVWNEFCDWYLEFTKPVLASGDSEVEKETKATIAWTLSQILHLLHPIMPYITEELWETIGGEGAGPLISAVWPTFDERYIDAAVEKEMDWVIRLITDIRATRAELNTPPALKAPLLLKDGTEEIKARIASYENVISWLARLSSLDAIEGDLPKGAIQIVLDDATFALPLEGIVDVTQEKARLSKEIEKTLSEIEKIDKKLANEQFISKAPEAVVKEQHSRRDDFQATLNELNAAVERLADL